MKRTHCTMTGIVAWGMLAGIAASSAAGADRDADAPTYREVRKLYAVALQLPRAVRGIRPEHREMSDAARAFLRSKRQSASAGEKAGVLYMRGTIVLKYGLFKRARHDIEASLKMAEDLEGEARPLGLPSNAVLRTFLAVTRLEDGLVPFLNALDDVPGFEDANVPDFLREMLYTIAAELEETDNLDQAIRVYRAIAKLNAWNPEKDRDPHKMIEVLEYRLKNLRKHEQGMDLE